MSEASDLPGQQNPFANFPQELRQLKHWCVWRKLWNAQRGKFDKPPYQSLNPQYGCSSKNFDQWSTFDQAVAAYQDSNSTRDPDHPNVPLAGIGIIIRPPFFGVDFDRVRNAETGVIEAWTLQFMRRWPTYYEVSPSGTGVHGIFHGIPPQIEDPKNPLIKKPAHFKGDRIELYGIDRYFTVTGKRL